MKKSKGRFSREDSNKAPRFKRDHSSKKFSRDRPTSMHTVTCDKCRKKCDVPFLPTEGKPVFCSDCFRKESKDSSKKPGNDKGNSFAEELKVINHKLDKILEALDM